MNYQFEDTNPGFSVPNRVVDGLLGVATGPQLKVLLFLLRFTALAQDSESIAKFCNIDPADVDSAVDFWVRERVLVRQEGKLRLVSGTQTVLPRELPRVQPNIILEETSQDFRDMISEVQRLTGKTMGAMMVSLFYNMTENLQFPPEMAVQLAAYCNSIGKFSYRYMETVATEWYDNGIDTFEKAEEKIRRLEQAKALERRLARAFGVQTAFSKKQSQQIAHWQELGIAEDLIREAYDRCMDHKNQMSFAYMNKILEDWHQKGYQKAADIPKTEGARTPGQGEHKGLSQLEQMMIGKMQSEET